MAQDPSQPLTPETLLRAYAMGIFPMAESRDDPDIYWVDPRKRGIFPLDQFHISRSLRRRLLKADYSVTIDTAFQAVLEGCADRPETWINPQIAALYRDLYEAGFAHSLEVWSGRDLIGGVYGVALGGAFFGESMFSRRRDASKIALAWLVHRLHAGGYLLFDTQFLTPHLESLGGREIARSAYHQLLRTALEQPGQFAPEGYRPYPSLISSIGSS